MQVVNPALITNKTVLLRLDLDVPIQNGRILDDFRLLAGMDTLGLCLEHAKSVIIMGHIGRPEGREVPELSVKPIVDWLEEGYGHILLPEGKLHILENLRFEPGEEASDPQFAKELAGFGDYYVNEAFASHHKSASTTVLPTLLPHAAGLNFAHEVKELSKVRNNPDKPLVVIIGGAKIEDKLPAVLALSKVADAVLVGGKLVAEIRDKNIALPPNVLVGMMREDGLDIAPSTTQSWEKVIMGSKMVLWNGPLGKVEDESCQQSQKIAQMILNSGSKPIIGGGDTIGFLDKLGLLDRFDQSGFISTGGGAMLKFLAEGTLPTIQALQ